MKKHIYALSFIFISLFTSSAVTAQQKIGYVNSNEVLSILPQAQKADKDLQAFANELQTALQMLATKIEKEIGDFQKNEKTLTEAMKETKRSEIVSMQKNLEEQQQSAQDKLSKKREALYQPIFEIINKAIKKVAEENKYTYVIDASGGSLLYAAETENILPLIKKALAIQ